MHRSRVGQSGKVVVAVGVGIPAGDLILGGKILQL